MSDPPLIEMISEDPVLRNTKLISEAWDCDGLFQVRASLYRLSVSLLPTVVTAKVVVSVMSALEGL